MFKDMLIPRFFLEKDGEGDPGASGGASNVIDWSKADWSKADWSKVDPSVLPKDVIEKSTVYKGIVEDRDKIKQESINRRLTVKELRAQLNQALPDEPNTSGEDPTKTDAKPKTEPSDLEKKVDDLLKVFNAQQTDNLKSWRDQAGKLTGINSKSVLENLTGNNLAEVVAKAQTIASELGIKPPPTSSGSTGNPVQERSKEFQAEVRAKMTGAQNKSVFGQDAMRNLGGGVVDMYGND